MQNDATEAERAAAKKAVGWGVSIGFGVAVLWIGGSFLSAAMRSPAGFSITFFLGIGVTLAVAYGQYEHRLAEIVRERVERQRLDAVRQDQQRRELKERETAAAAGRCSQLRQAIMAGSKLLQDNRARLPKLLERAAEEYRVGAFGPFWDCVEAAAEVLAVSQDTASRLAVSAREYASLQHARNQPALALAPVDNLAFPEFAKRFDALVRTAQRNFQFAVIWEHRKTRSVMMRGFATIGDVVAGVGDAVAVSIDDFRDSIRDLYILSGGDI